MRRRVAIVTPWYGEESTGGAESLARELAARLSATDDVIILTTTSRSFLSEWDVDYFDSGTSAGLDGYAVRRFSVTRRNREVFDRVNAGLLELPKERWSESAGRDAATRPFIDESINSAELEAHLGCEAVTAYDAVIFIPYLYGVVVRGIEAYPGPAHLVPCLHDEAYARIPAIEAAIHRSRTLLFNSSGEAELAVRLYGPGVLHKSVVAGSGVPRPSAPVPASPIVGSYVLYLGRRDGTKNVDMLVDAYRRYRAQAENGKGLQLVLAGPGMQSYDDRSNGVLDLGFIDNKMKSGLLRGAKALVQPSANESYSRVIMEAWLQGTPVVVHGDCLATAFAVREAGGGFTAIHPEEWTNALKYLEELDADERLRLGRLGEQFASTHADWDRVVERVHEAIGFVSRLAEPSGRRVDQVLQTLEYGDAISDEALHIQERLRELGHESTIFAEGIGTLVADRAVWFDAVKVQDADALIYHHSIRSAATEVVASAQIPKAMIYHNITPASFFEPYAPEYADLLAAGVEQTRALTQGRFDCYYADSAFNAAELRGLGAGSVSVLPVVVDFRRFDRMPSAEVMSRLKQGSQWLFVGRVAPNKGIRALLEAFEVFLCYDPRAILTVVGRFDPADLYFQALRSIVLERRLERNVTFTGLVTEEQLLAHYRTSDVFVCLSEHEGFCVPLVEAMWFDIPIVALAQTAIPETMGKAGILFEHGTDSTIIAATVREVLLDGVLRRAVLEAQRERRREFTPQRVRVGVDQLVKALL